MMSFPTRLEHPNKLLHTIFERLYDNDIVSEDGFQVNSWISQDKIVLIFHPIFSVMGEERRPSGTGGEGSRHQVVHTILHLAQGGNATQFWSLANVLCIPMLHIRFTRIVLQCIAQIYRTINLTL